MFDGSGYIKKKVKVKLRDDNVSILYYKVKLCLPYGLTEANISLSHKVRRIEA